jgi:hypothetical protein
VMQAWCQHTLLQRPQHRHHTASLSNPYTMLALSEPSGPHSSSCLIRCSKTQRGVQKPSSQCIVTPSTQHHKC